MDFDTFFSTVLPSGDDLALPKHKRHLKIGMKFVHTKGSRVLCVLVPAWHGRLDHYKMMQKTICKSSLSCLEYEFPDEILSIDHKYTKHCIEDVARNMHAHVKELIAKHNFSSIHVIASSLGTCPGMMLANKEKSVSKVILHAPSHSLAHAFWDGVRTRQMRDELERRGVTLEELESLWAPLSPENNIVGLRGKDVHVVISKDDKVVPYKQAKVLIRQLKKSGAKVQVQEYDHLGHYLLIVEELLNVTDI